MKELHNIFFVFLYYLKQVSENTKLFIQKCSYSCCKKSIHIVILSTSDKKALVFKKT